MSISLTKNQKVTLTKEVEGLRKVVVGLGWDVAKKGFFGGTYDIDCDASAILLDKNEKYAGCVYFGNRRDANGCVVHHGDNLTGAGDGDDEQITVNLADMSGNISKVVFVVNIYDCKRKKQDFGMIKNAFIRLVDSSTNKEICKYNLSDNYSGMTAMIFGEVYKENNEWEFNAIGKGTTDSGLSQIINNYR